ncbi:MAG: hypothetical protein WCF85_20540 [Rhodospirillaceae bacterium]
MDSLSAAVADGLDHHGLLRNAVIVSEQEIRDPVTLRKISGGMQVRRRLPSEGRCAPTTV